MSCISVRCQNFRFDHENWLVKCARLRDETNCRSQKNDGCFVEYFPQMLAKMAIEDPSFSEKLRY